MDATAELLCQKYQEDLEYFSLQLKSLSQAIDTISIAFQHQCIEEDVIGSLETLRHSVNGIKVEIDKKISDTLSLS